MNISNWRVFSKSHDEELQPELELDFSLSQLPICIILPLRPAPMHEYLQEKAGPSRPSKQSRVEQQWHESLQQDAHALVICSRLDALNLTLKM